MFQVETNQALKLIRFDRTVSYCHKMFQVETNHDFNFKLQAVDRTKSVSYCHKMFQVRKLIKL